MNGAAEWEGRVELRWLLVRCGLPWVVLACGVERPWNTGVTPAEPWVQRPHVTCERPRTPVYVPLAPTDAKSCASHVDCENQEFCGAGRCLAQYEPDLTLCINGLSVEGELPASRMPEMLPSETEWAVWLDGGVLEDDYYGEIDLQVSTTGRFTEFEGACTVFWGALNAVPDQLGYDYYVKGYSWVLVGAHDLHGSGPPGASEPFWGNSAAYLMDYYSRDDGPVHESQMGDYWFVDQGCIEAVTYAEAWDGSLTTLRVVFSVWYP